MSETATLEQENVALEQGLGNFEQQVNPVVAELSPVEEWQQHFTQSVVDSKTLQGVVLPTREEILGRWFKEGDLGFIFGPRGLGKTWLSMYFAHAIAGGKQAGPWNAPKPRKVLYIDGEMPLDETQGRDKLLSTGKGQVTYLHHEVLFEKTGAVLNLTSPEVQEAILTYCKDEKVEVVFLDNLSCLFSGMKENEADSWEQVLHWLLALRRARIAVIFIHHAGRNGQMRGTSRREDAAFWVIKLSPGRLSLNPQDGAAFATSFAKNRNTTEQDAPSLEWQFKKESENEVSIAHQKSSNMQIFRQCLEDGLTSCTDIAEEMGMSKGGVSKLAKKAERDGLLRSNGRGGYELIEQAD
ncbi:MAG: AAA family ATPase [bacterium]